MVEQTAEVQENTPAPAQPAEAPLAKPSFFENLLNGLKGVENISISSISEHPLTPTKEPPTPEANAPHQESETTKNG